MHSWQQQVLEDIGISLLQPRFVFPAAKAGQALVFEPLPPPAQAEPAHTATHDAPAQASQSGPAPAAAGIAELSRTLGLPAAAPAPVATVPAPDAAAPSASLRYRLRLVRVGRLLMLLDQPALQWAEQQAALRFFADIHFYLFGEPAAECSETVFTWPPARQFPLADDADCARQTLATFVSGFAGDDVSWLLLWGETVTGRLLGKTVDKGEVLLHERLRLLQLDEVSAYWRQPASKRLLWQYLQAIVRQQAHG